MEELSKIKSILELMRPWQWYKNLLVFLPLVFGLELFNASAVVLAFVAFIALCLVSSAGYVLNDLVDAAADRKHPEKKHKPIASGKLSGEEGVLLSLVFLVASLVIALPVHLLLPVLLFCLYFSFGVYSLWLKKEPVIDIILIAVNYVLRAFAGVLAIGVPASPWLVLCTFFLALFLGAGKREAEQAFLKVKTGYAPKIAHMMMVVSTSLLLFSYALYSFFSKYPGLFVTIPIAFYTVLRYASLVYSGSAVGRHPHLALKDIRLVTAIILWAIVSLAVLYF